MIEFQTIYPEGVTEESFGETNTYCYRETIDGVTGEILFSADIADLNAAIAAHGTTVDYDLEVWAKAGANLVSATDNRILLKSGHFDFYFNGGNLLGGFLNGNGIIQTDSPNMLVGSRLNIRDLDYDRTTAHSQLIKTGGPSSGSGLAITIVNSRFDWADSVMFANTWDKANLDIILDGCEISNQSNSGAGVIVSSAAGLIEVRNCVFDNCLYGIGDKSDSTEPLTVRVTGCTFIDCGSNKGAGDFTACVRAESNNSDAGQAVSVEISDTQFVWTDAAPYSTAIIGENRSGKSAIKGSQTTVISNCTATVGGESVPVKVQFAAENSNQQLVEIPAGYDLAEFTFDAATVLADVDWTQYVVPAEEPEVDVEPTALGGTEFSRQYPAARTESDVGGARTVLGVSAEAEAGGTAIGHRAKARGVNSAAFGKGVKATHDFAFAIGVNSKAAGDKSQPTLSLPDAEHIYIGTVTLASLLGV